MNNENTPGFISVDQAVELIGRHTQDKPTVDLLYLMDNINRVRVGRNFSFYRAELDKNGTRKRVYPPIAVTIYDEENKVDVKRAIRNKVEEVTGKRFATLADIGLRKVANIVDDQHGTTARARNNTDSKIKLGDTISSGTTFNSNKL